MKNLLMVAAALAALPACAATNGASHGQSSSGAPAMYCWETRLVVEGDTLSCNWAASPKEACRSTEFGAVRKAAVASGPENARRRCENGEWLVRVTMK